MGLNGAYKRNLELREHHLVEPATQLTFGYIW